MKCLDCGAELVQIPKKRTKQFCDSTCRSNFWQRAKRLKGKMTFVVNKNKAPDNMVLGVFMPKGELQEDIQKQISDYEEELKTIPDIGLGKKRRIFLQSKISELKRQLR